MSIHERRRGRGLRLLFGLLLVSFVSLGSLAQAQSYDPYTSNVSILDPNENLLPLRPVEFNGTGIFTFQAGNNGGSDLVYDPNATPGNWMGLTISIANGVPYVETAADPENPTEAEAVSVLQGVLLDYFSFTYTPATRVYTGTQKATIPGFSSFEGRFPYRVTNNRFSTQPIPNLGAIVNVQPPGYTNPQPTDNDSASSYTFVAASDFGDAPQTFGGARHAIDVAKTAGKYNRFMYLGTHIDHDDAFQFSALADGDDLNTGDGLFGIPADDEDGVAWPPSLPIGQTTNVPVHGHDLGWKSRSGTAR
jgi:hypothetical protein